MTQIDPGTEVTARGLSWELVYTQNLGSQVLHCLRGLEGDFSGQEIELLDPFKEVTPILLVEYVRNNQHHSPTSSLPSNLQRLQGAQNLLRRYREHRSVDTLFKEFQALRLLGYAPVRWQMFNILWAVNRERKAAGFEPVPHEAVHKRLAFHFDLED